MLSYNKEGSFMMKSIRYILISLFIGLLFQTAALKFEETADSSAKGSLVFQTTAEEGSQKAEKSADSTKDVEKNKKTVNKKSAQKDKRQIAGTAYNCSEFWTDEFSIGYVQVGTKCSSEDSLCLAFFHIARNYCEEGNLIRYYCDPKQPSLFSTEKIKCEKSCEFSGLSGSCVK